MSGLVTAAVGTAVVGGIYKGSRAATTNLAPARAAALDLKNEQMALLGDVKTQAIQEADLGYSSAMTQFGGTQRDLSMGAGIGLRDIMASADTATSKSGLATSGTIEKKVSTQTGDLMAKYKSDMTKLFETRTLAQKERDLSESSADLAYRRGEMSAEDAYQSTLTGIEQTPDTFWEGFFG